MCSEIKGVTTRPYSYKSYLGVLWREQGKHDEAEKPLREVLQGQRKKLGPDHPHTLESTHELAVLHIRQARYEEAEPFLLEAIKGRQLKLGDQHPHTQEPMNNLIELYEAWGKPERIENVEPIMSNSEL